MDDKDAQMYDDLHDQWMERGRRIRNLEKRVVKLEADKKSWEAAAQRQYEDKTKYRRALEWALEKRARLGAYYNCVFVGACGCCEQELPLSEVPKKIRKLLRRKRKRWLIQTEKEYEERNPE